MSCAEFFQKSGWHCASIQDDTLYVSTPVTLPGGKPADFYLERAGDKYRFSDDGITIFALRAAGFDLTDRRNWRGLETLVSGLGFSLKDNGEVNCMFRDEQFHVWGERIIRLFSGIAKWAEDKLAENDADFSLTAEIERVLREKAPTADLKRHVKVTLGGTPTVFDFQWGQTFVDAVRPVAPSVNSKLRKAALIRRQGDPAVKVLFVIDDTGSITQAEREQSVLGVFAPTVRLAEFREQPYLH